ncbi:MAG: T9SS type A sorting domain-containing protein [Flavobacteriales bacterium]
MKHIYAAVTLLAIAGSAMAQRGTVKPFLTEKAHVGQPVANAHPDAHPTNISQGSERAAFYTNDFSAGFPAGWTTVDDLTPSADTPVNFVWADDPGAVTIAAANQPLILTFLAPGASNGFLWANSDRGLASAPATNHLTRLTTTAIDCSGQPSVLLTMQSTIGVFDLDADTACKVRVSTDGVNWTNFAPFPCLVTGNINPPCERFSANPQSVAIDISSVAANQTNVFLQFQWRGGWEYYWAIDDLQLSPIPDNEIVMDLGYTAQFGRGYEFGRVPSSQLLPTVNAGAEVANSGANVQTNVSVNISMKDAGANEVAGANVDLGTINSGDTALADVNLTLPNSLAPGIYTTDFTMTSDQIGDDSDPGNNSKQRSFAITDDLYSLDGLGIYPPASVATGQGGTNSFLDNTVGVGFLNYYQVNAQATFYGVEMLLGPSSAAGSIFHVAIYDTTDVAAGQVLNNEIVVSEDRVVTPAEIAAGMVQIQFLDQVALPAGGYYVAAILSQSDGNDFTIMDDLTVPQPFDASLIFVPNDAPDNVFIYSNGNAWAIRLSADPSIGINEVPGLPGVSIYPNPTTGVLHINTTKAEPTTVEVRNVLGAIVKTATFTGTVNTIDLAGYDAGVYTVRIGNGANYAVKLVTLQ